MEHIPQSKAQRFENGAITSWEYSMRDATLNMARISINGRYPEEGFTSNLESDSLVHVTEGNGRIQLNGGASVELIKNDQVHLAIGDTYYFEGNMDIIYAASPKWSPEQTVRSR